MLSENIKTLRKQKGFSQEMLAERLHVVRQTVSKWEKGLSVPDAELLREMAELFDVPVSALLGGKIEEETPPSPEMQKIADQLALLNEQLADRSASRRRTVRRVLICIAAALILLIALYVFCFWRYKVLPRRSAVYTTVRVECTLDGETYYYELCYDQNFQVHEAGGDAWINDHVMPGSYGDDANVMLAQIEDYFTERGGTFRIIE